MGRILWGWEIRVFSLEGSSGRLCDGVSRREILRAGGLGLLGLSAAGLDRLQKISGSAPAPTVAPPTFC